LPIRRLDKLIYYLVGRERPFRMVSKSAPLIACHDCDLLQREIPLNPGCSATCLRCGALLYRNATESIDRTLAYTLSAATVFVIANLFPLFAIEVQGSISAITLLGAVTSLWGQGMKIVSLVVCVTTVLVPALELSTMTYLLLPLKFRHVPPGYTFLLRMMRAVEPWGMIEVFMLGVLVSLVKLTSSFKVIPGVALWSFAVLTLLLAAAAASFSTRDIWARLDQIPKPQGAP
jgi:paraquat-inducible protein A